MTGIFKLLLVWISTCYGLSYGSPDQNRLFEDLMANYNKLVRPIKNHSEAIKIQFKLKLVQILDVHEKNQVVTTNGWLIHIWHDYKLSWNPEEYGGITMMHLPSELIWLPDIILYNNADGSPTVTTMTKAHVNYQGTVMWEPPVVYNSMCQINIEWFPFDEQFCEIKFGSWTYYGSELSMVHLASDDIVETVEKDETVWTVQRGIDLKEYQESVEWDLMQVIGTRHEKWYPCCNYPFVDITYYIDIRRKTLFYTINLITPCVGITFLTSLVFYLPSDSNNKITLCISVLVSLTVFFLLLIEIIPPTSLVIPLIGRYLLFTMILISLSVMITVIILNIHYRSATTHPMSDTIRTVFIHWLPRLLRVSRTSTRRYSTFTGGDSLIPTDVKLVLANEDFRLSKTDLYHRGSGDLNPKKADRQLQNAILTLENAKMKACMNVCYIADQLRIQDAENAMKEDWKFVAMMIDRLFLIIFSTSIFFGTVWIIFSAPMLRDTREPVTEQVKAELKNLTLL